MSYSGNQFGDVTQRVGVQLAAMVLAHAEPIGVLSKLGKAAITETIGRNKGKTVKWRRLIPFTVTNTPLVEGVTPPPQLFQSEIKEATILQYGNWVAITDHVADTHEDPILKDAAQLCGEQVANLRELLMWAELRAGTSVVYTNGSARTDVNTPIDRDAFSSVIRTLKANHTPKLTKQLSASGNFGTTPVAAAYVAVGHTDFDKDCRDMDGFRPVEEYASGGVLCPEEIGKVEETRIILSPQLSPFLGAGSSTTNGMKSTGGVVDVYPMIVFGEEAFANVYLSGMNDAQMLVKQPGSMPTYEDPLNQRGFVSWKTWFACKILNDQRMIRIEAAVTSL